MRHEVRYERLLGNVVKLALAVALAACEGAPVAVEVDGCFAEIGGPAVGECDRGALEITVAGLPSEVAADLLVTGPGGFTASLSSTDSLLNMVPGNYTLEAARVSEPVAPAAQGSGGPLPADGDGKRSWRPSFTRLDVTIERQRRKRVKVDYAPVVGSLSVTTAGLPEGAKGTVNVEGPGGYRQSLTGSGDLTDLTPGDYMVTAESLSSGDSTYTPAPETQVVAVLEDTAVVAAVAYAVATPEYGTLVLGISGLPSGGAGRVTLSGPNGYSLSLVSGATLRWLTPGTYTIDAQDVTISGTTYQAAPPTQSVSIAGGQTQNVSVSYALPSVGYGTLAVTITGLPSGASGSVAITGPNGYSHPLSSSATLGWLAPGSYTVQAAGVSVAGTSYTASPATQTVSVLAGQTRTATVGYSTASTSLGTLQPSPTSLSLTGVGTTALLTLVARNASGAVIAPTGVQWSSSNTSVATVSSSGLVTARGPGSAQISVSATCCTGASVPVAVQSQPTSGGGGALAWSSGWSSGTGTSTTAILDGSAFNAQNGPFSNTIHRLSIVSRNGSHALRIGYQSGDGGHMVKCNRCWPEPAVGQYLFSRHRLYIDAGPGDNVRGHWFHHGSNSDGSGRYLMFWNSETTSVRSNGTFDLMVDTRGGGGFVWSGARVRTDYVLETRLHFVSSNQTRIDVRISDATGVVATSTSFVCRSGSCSYGSEDVGAKLRTHALSAYSRTSIEIGNNGGVPQPATVKYRYVDDVAIRVSSDPGAWIGR